VVEKVTALQDAVLKAQTPQAFATEVRRLGEDAKAAIAMAAATPVNPADPAYSGLTPSGLTPADPAYSGLTPSGLTPSGLTPSGLTPSGLTPSGLMNPTAPLVPSTSTTPANSASLPLQEVLNDLQESVDRLVILATSGDVAGALRAVADVGERLAAVVLALLSGVIPGLSLDQLDQIT
jgi:hypothetical protein